MFDLQAYLDHCSQSVKQTSPQPLADEAGAALLMTSNERLNRGIDEVSVLGSSPAATPEEFRTWPFRTTCQLHIVLADGALAIASGTLFGSFEQVVTCAHNLYNKARGGFAREVTAYFPDPLGQSTAHKIEVKAYPIAPGDKYTWVNPAYVQKANSGVASHDMPEEDWAMITLKKEFKVLRENKVYQGKVGFVTGAMNALSTEGIFEHKTAVTSVGYPRNKGYDMVIGQGNVQKLYGAVPRIDYDIPVDEGHSGGSVYAEFNLPAHKGRFLVGVHAGHQGATSFGARFNIDRIHTMRKFIEATQTS